MTYNQFAEVYDELMQDAPYDEWVELTEKILADRNFSNKASILDVGCGTGEIAIRLNQRGYQVTGVDYSSEMLAIAQHKAMEVKEDVAWINQDMRELEGFQNFDVCISYCDVINYVTKEQEILDVCKKVASSLQKNGLFIFDVHDANYATSELAGHTFAEVTDETSYIWECDEGDQEGLLLHDITFFQKVDKNRYKKFTEQHEQQVYPMEFYESVLKEAGFTKINYFHDFQLENKFSSENRKRNFIIAEK